jgi:ABC-type microcin C transport system permease subunit YejE
MVPRLRGMRILRALERSLAPRGELVAYQIRDTLGRMIGEGRHQMLTAPWVVVVPTLVILALTLCVQAIGDWLRDRADPRA